MLDRLLKGLKVDYSPHRFRSPSGPGVRTRGSTGRWRSSPWSTRSAAKSSKCYARGNVLERRREIMEHYGSACGAKYTEARVDSPPRRITGGP